MKYWKIVLCYLLMMITISCNQDNKILNPSPSPRTAYLETPQNEQTKETTLTPGFTSIVTNAPRITETTTSTLTSSTVIATFPSEYKLYIGLSIPPLPDNIREKGSTLIDSLENYGLHLVLLENGSFMIWFTRSGRVIDVLLLPDLGKEDGISTNYCLVNGKKDPEIITISVFDQVAVRTRYFTNDKIRKAWRANRSTNHIEPISTAGIECSAEGGFDPNGITSRH